MGLAQVHFLYMVQLMEQGAAGACVCRRYNQILLRIKEFIGGHVEMGIHRPYAVLLHIYIMVGIEPPVSAI